MNVTNEPTAPVLIKDTVLDGRGTRFGKTVIERLFRMPDGKELPILYVTTSGFVPVIIFPYSDKGTIFLVYQYRFGTNVWTYELPGGCQEEGNTFVETARIELLEETGVEAKKFEVIGGPMPLNPALEDARAIAVVATGCRLVKEQQLEATETAVVREVTIAEFRKMALKGEIVDSKTVAIFYLALDHLGLLG